MGQANDRGSKQERIDQANKNQINDTNSVKTAGQKQNKSDKNENSVKDTVGQFASELGLPTTLLLEQLSSAGVPKSSASDQLTERDKSALLDYLRREHGAANSRRGKITLTRRSANDGNNKKNEKTNIGITVAGFASQLGLPTSLVLEQLQGAGISKSNAADQLSGRDKSVLLDYIRKEHGRANLPKPKITLTSNTLNKPSEAQRNITVEVRKKTVLDRPEQTAETVKQITPAEAQKNTLLPFGIMESMFKVGEEEVLDLCTRQEDDFFDRKSIRIKPTQLQDIAVAFANAEGGTIVVGIEDDKADKGEGNPTRRWQGADHIEYYNPYIATLSSLNPSIDYVHQFLRWDGGYSQTFILKLTIRKGQKAHHTTGGEYFLRRGAQSLTIKGAQVQELIRAKGVYSEEDTLLPTVRAETIIEGEHFRNFLANLRITDKDPLSFALKEKLISEDMVPTVALVLLFADNPSSDMPSQCAVKIVRYDTSDEEFERDDLTDDRHTIEGPLHQQVADAFKTLKEVIGRCECWTLDGLKTPSYPDEALYEVLVNSVLHRDYGVSDNVLISVYRNRVEFRSPGRLPGFITVKNIREARFSRNAKLVRLLAKYPDAVNKDLGEGMNTVFQRMRKAGFVDPILHDNGVNLFVTLKREPKEDHTSVILKFVEIHGSITNRQALDILGLEQPEQATALFGKMRDQKLLIRGSEKQSGAGVRWVKPVTT